MDVTEKNLLKFNRLMAAMDEDSLTRAEFVKAFENVISLIIKIEEKLQKNNNSSIEFVKKTYTDLIEKIKNDENLNLLEIKEKVKKTLDECSSYCSSEMNKIMKMHDMQMEEIDAQIQEFYDDKANVETRVTENVLSKIKLPEQKENILDTPEQMRDKLETLKEDARIDKSAIKGLEETVTELKTMIANIPRAGGGSGPNANALQAHYFTGDGTKAYYVPKHRNALMLIGTAGPVMFKKTTDWTTSNNTLTLNAALNDVVGQEYVLLYVR